MQRIFGKEVASLEAIGFYKKRDNIFNFDILLCTVESFSFLSKHENYVNKKFTRVSTKFYVIGEEGMEFYKEHQDSIKKIENVLEKVNEFYNQEGAIISRAYEDMNNFYLNHIENENIVPKDKIDFVNSLSITDHYAYVDDIKHYLNEEKIPLLGVFSTPMENDFKEDDIRLIVNPMTIENEEVIGYEVVIFIGSGFKSKLMYMSLTVRMSEVKGINLD